MVNTISKLEKKLAWNRLSQAEKDIVIEIKASFKDQLVVKEVKKIGFSASKIFYDKGNGGCPRYWNILFEGTTVEDTWKHPNLRAVDVGSTSHDFLQNELKENIPDIEIEKELWHKNPNIHGFVDAYLPKTNTPLEIKTTRYENFEWRAQKMVGTESNIMQLILYMFLLDSDFGCLIYEDRNSLDNIIIPVRMDDENRRKIEAAFAWMLEVQQAYEAGEVIQEFPGKRINSVTCNSCEVKAQCESSFPKGTVSIPLLKTALRAKDES